MQAYISAIGTAVPKYKIEQSKIAEFMCKVHQLTEVEKNRLQALYRATGIESRYSVLRDYGSGKGDFSFYENSDDLEPFPGTQKRMKIYEQEAKDLAYNASLDCLNSLKSFRKELITHLITVSCTGMYAPGLDIDLVNKLELKPSVERTAINFMGCYAAFSALKVGSAICKSDPEAKVLIVCVELCSIHFQKNKSEDNMLANALFADGGAAILLESQPSGQPALSIENFHCDLLSKNAEDMAWKVSDFGFEMRLSSYVPDIIREGIRKLVERLKDSLSYPIEHFDKYAVHPGGKKILEAMEEEVGFCKKENKYAYEVLRNFGNMSSPTILFVLKALWLDLTKSDDQGTILSVAFGPGLTLESMVLKIHC
ncbi:type III polyketide synthase [Fulvivirgaceae bacterium BMA10]|uniref:Type III polyketide synthase n=1 Tax=Splendidivirga corallicola TaxID=3051826 RepID=A0ABT8KM05_9BACT|nr:type III polyketide synthase [Fulvivirgaceae bacterium BMA10]